MLTALIIWLSERLDSDWSITETSHLIFSKMHCCTKKIKVAKKTKKQHFLHLNVT